MNRISVNYTIKYELSIATHYVWTTNNLCFNLKTGRKIKQVYNNGCLGYSIQGKFMSLKKLRPLLIKPIEPTLPF
jgi:hypothetical protein